MRTIGISHMFQPLEEAISEKFLPSLTGQWSLTKEERDLLALPCRLGGLNVVDSSKLYEHQHAASCRIADHLTSLIVQQENALSEEKSHEKGED